jgi:hypothetical protein
VTRGFCLEAARSTEATLVTTNQLAASGEVLHDGDLAEAILDRQSPDGRTSTSPAIVA